MFDDVPARRPSATGDDFAPFDADDDYDELRRRQAARGRRARLPRARAASSCPRATPTTRRTPRPSTASATARTSSCSSCIARDGVEVYEGSVRYLRRRARRRAATRRRVLRAPTPSRCSRRPGIARPLRGARRRRSSPSASTCRASPRPTRSCAAPSGSASSRRQAAVFEDALAGRRGRPRRRLRLRRRRRPRRPGRRAARARRRRRRRATWRSCWPMSDEHPDFAVEPVGASARHGLDLGLLAQSESVFALSNGHIGLRGNLDEGEPAGAARHLPQRLLRGRGRCPTPRPATATPRTGQTVVNVTDGKLIRLLVDDEPFDVRYGELLEHERVLDLRAGTLRRDGRTGARRRAARCELRSTRLVSLHPARGRGDPLRGRGASTTAGRASSCSPSWSPTSRGRRAVRRPARRRRARARRSSPRTAAATTPRVVLVHRTRAQRAARGGRRWTTSSTGPTARCADAERRGRPRPRDDRRPTLEPGETLRVRQVPRLRLVGAALACRRCATRSRRPRRGAPHRLGRPVRRAARVPRRLLGAAPTSRSTATPSSSRRVRFALFHVAAGRARAPSAARSRPRA